MPNNPKRKLSLYAIKARGLYLRWLYYKHRQFTLAGLLDDDQPIALKQIYVPLRLAQEMVSEEIDEKKLQETGQSISQWLMPRGATELDPVRSTRLNYKPNYAIQGLPGSGKSTLVQHLAADLSNPEPTALQQQFPDCLPVPMILREFDLSKMQRFEDLLDAHFQEAKTWIEEKFGEGFDPKDLEDYFKSGLGLFMLDGVDEVGNLNQRTQFFKWVKKYEGFVFSKTETDLGLSNRLLVTGRPSGFEGLNQYLRQFSTLHVLPFNREQIKTFVSRWYGLRAAWVTNKTKRIVALETAISEMPHLSVLARRPAFLTMMAFIHGSRGALPHTRAMLYEQITDAYISLLDQQRDLLGKGDFPLWPHNEKKDLLSVIAYKSHIGRENGYSENRLIQWPRQQMVEEMREALKNERVFRIAKPEDAENLTRYYLARTGLLQEPKPGYVQFGHLSFQEYLTALYLLNEATGKGRKKLEFLKLNLIGKLNAPGWVEVAFLLMALEAERTRGQGAWDMLCQLDLNEKGARRLLAEVLRAGQEIRLTEKDRAFWLGCLLAASAYHEDYTIAGILGQAEDLHNIGQSLIHKAILAWQAGNSPYDALLVECPERDEKDPKCGTCWPQKTGKACGCDSLDDDAASIIAFAVLAGWWSPEADDATVQKMPDIARLFRTKDNGLPSPSPLMTSLVAVARPGSKLPALLLQRSPLSWIYLDHGASYWTNLLPFAAGDSDVRIPDGLKTYFTEWTILEMIALDRGMRPITSQALDRAQARTLYLTLDQARALDRARDQALDRVSDMIMDLSLDHDWARSMSRALARARTRYSASIQNLDLARSMARALDQTLDRDWNLYRALAQALARALDRARDLALDLDLGRMRIFEKIVRTTIWITSYDLLLENGAKLPKTLPELRELRDRFANPNRVSELFPEEDQARRKEEWEWILKQDWSPISYVDEFLASNPEDKDIWPETSLRRFTTELNEWETRLKKPNVQNN